MVRAMIVSRAPDWTELRFFFTVDIKTEDGTENIAISFTLEEIHRTKNDFVECFSFSFVRKTLEYFYYVTACGVVRHDAWAFEPIYHTVRKTKAISLSNGPYGRLKSFC